MLNQFRSYARSLSTKILLGLLILTFGVWGIGDMLNQSTASSHIAQVGSLYIPMNEYQQLLTSESEKLRNMLGKQYSPDLLKQLGTDAQVLQKLVDNRLLILESRKLGIRVGDEDIADPRLLLDGERLGHRSGVDDDVVVDAEAGQEMPRDEPA